jgi:molecular chaperone DnaK (HSP70)
VEVKRVIGTSDWTTEQYGRSYGPSEISALILRKLVADAQTITGDTISDVVITCPAYFGRNRIEATRQAGQLAGLDVHFVIPEPTAAAIAYEMDQSSDQTLLVFDLGGGTFDISVIEIKKDGAITVICVGGDDHLGGTHWDQTVANWFATEIADAVGVDPDEVMEDAEVWQELLSTAEEAKIRLTSAKKFTGKVLYEADRVPLELSREKFDEITGQLLAKTISLTHEVISTARDKGHGQIDKILLVGGSTYMPQIRERVESEFNMEVVQFDPNQAVAKGAARFGFMCQLDEQIKIGIAEETGQSVDDVDLEAVPEEVKSKVERDVANDYGLTLPGLQSMSKEISNVTAKSFGVVVLTGPGPEDLGVSNLISANDPVPHEVTQQYSTASDNQQGVLIRCMENTNSAGPDDDAIPLETSEEIGVTELMFEHSMPKGSPIEVTFSLAADGELSVLAKEPTTNRTVDAQFKTEGAILLPEEIREKGAHVRGLRLSS